MSQTRERRLFAAARHYLELRPMDRTNWWAEGTESHLHHLSCLAAEDELLAALAAYEHTSPLPAGRGEEAAATAAAGEGPPVPQRPGMEWEEPTS